jgi:hypothetical protein
MNFPFSPAPVLRRLSVFPPVLFPKGLFQYLEGFVKTLEKFGKVIGKKDHRLAFKAPGVPVFAFHDIEVEISQAVFFYVKKVGPVL